MDNDAPGGCAALPGRADRAEQDRARCQIEVCILGHDDGVVAAEFQDGAAESPGNGFGHVLPDDRGAGEGDQRQTVIVQHAISDAAAGADDQVEDSAQIVIRHDSIGNMLYGNRA